MRRICRCGSFAINDKPETGLCDKCWRDDEITRLTIENGHHLEDRKRIEAILGTMFTPRGTESWSATACRGIAALQQVDVARAGRLEAVMKDFRDHGLRMDLNPTHRLGDNEESERFWHAYIRRADATVRETAERVLGLFVKTQEELGDRET